MQLNLADLQKLLEQQPQQLQQGIPSIGELLALSQQRRGPMMQSREIDPGMSWGGRDQNAVQPNDYMGSRLYPALPEGT